MKSKQRKVARGQNENALQAALDFPEEAREETLRPAQLAKWSALDPQGFPDAIALVASLRQLGDWQARLHDWWELMRFPAEAEPPSGPGPVHEINGRKFDLEFRERVYVLPREALADLSREDPDRAERWKTTVEKISKTTIEEPIHDEPDWEKVLPQPLTEEDGADLAETLMRLETRFRGFMLKKFPWHPLPPVNPKGVAAWTSLAEKMRKAPVNADGLSMLAQVSQKGEFEQRHKVLCKSLAPVRTVRPVEKSVLPNKTRFPALGFSQQPDCQLYLPGLDPVPNRLPVPCIPLILFDENPACQELYHGSGVPLPLRLFVEVLLAFGARQTETPQPLLCTLRQLVDGLWPKGWRRRQDWPRLKRSLDLLTVSGVEWNNEKKGWYLATHHRAERAPRRGGFG